MTVLESGDLKGKKIGVVVADLARGAHCLHVAVIQNAKCKMQT